MTTAAAEAAPASEPAVEAAPPVARAPLWRDLLILSLLAVPAFFLGLGERDLWSSGEARIAEVIDHTRTNPRLPPPGERTLEFGEHLVKTACIVCHGETLSGGNMRNADPDWPAASNLTPHDEGLRGWTRDDFRDAMRLGRRPNGTRLDPSMPWRPMAEMSDVELDAIFMYLKSVETRGFMSATA